MSTTAGFPALQTVCWIAAHDPKARPCRLPIDRCHLIPKQWIKRQTRIEQGGPALTLEARRIQDPRVQVLGCRQHHGNLDYGGPGKIVLPRAAVPVECEEYADELGWVWMLDKLYGPSG